MRRLTLLFLSFMLLLSGCMPYVRQPPEAETTRITVGFSQVGAESDWRVANTESMRESLSEENGFELLFDNARQEQENQFKAIRTFIQQDVDYIVLAPVTETGWESVLEEARTAGIPIIMSTGRSRRTTTRSTRAGSVQTSEGPPTRPFHGWRRRWRPAKAKTRRYRSCICRARPAPRRSSSALPLWRQVRPVTRAG